MDNLNYSTFMFGKSKVARCGSIRIRMTIKKDEVNIWIHFTKTNKCGISLQSKLILADLPLQNRLSSRFINRATQSQTDTK
jgi:hypothetical protein